MISNIYKIKLHCFKRVILMILFSSYIFLINYLCYMI